MVSKIAVTALVLIVACPILLGYAMAFDTVQKSDWVSGEETNVTDLANNTLAWSYAAASPASMNGRNLYDVNNLAMPEYPLYNTFQASPYTTLQLEKANIAADTQINLAPDGAPGTVFTEINGTVDMEIRYTNTSMVLVTDTVTNVVSVGWSGDHVTGIYRSGGSYLGFDYTKVSWFKFPYDDVIVERYDASATYVDMSKGWTPNHQSNANHDGMRIWSINGLQSNAIVMTMDFGGLSWIPSFDVRGGTTDVTINPDINGTAFKINNVQVPAVFSGSSLASSGNVWQLVCDQDGIRMNYVKDWKDNYGLANAYYTLEIASSGQIYTGISTVEGVRYRADYANVRSISYPAMQNSTYDPATIIPDNTASYRITISNADQIGSSLTWGGETYPITDGKITIGSKKLDVNGLKLDSIYEDGTRTNMINGIEISTGTTTVTFGGLWSAIITQSQLTYETWVATEWTPGKFAWNGVDQSFALMGLITCAAVFVGLGMYGARSGAKVGKLMIICGCAAFVFLALM